MRWKNARKSTNVEDRRSGRAVKRGATVGGGAIILALVASFLLGENPIQILEQLGGGMTTTVDQQTPPPNDEAAEFVSRILGDLEETWHGVFRSANSTYSEPSVVLFSGQVQSACGYNTAATGPFYCPGDQNVYLDLTFFQELRRMGAAGDFAVAYVIAHEVGHHVQNITGTEREVRRLQGRVGQTQRNQLSVRMELQADCYAGVWANHAHTHRQLLEEGDVEEGLRAAAAVGDDRLQKASGRRVQPESFTHGTSDQRMQWFRSGLQSGQINSCDTFEGVLR